MAKLIWITGLAGSGKTTIGKKIYYKLKEKYVNTVFLDGDIFREILDNNFGYTIEDRLQIAVRIHKLCLFLTEQNINVVCATMSLFKEIYKLNRKYIKNYFEIFIECDMDELIRRDKKRLYSGALSGEIKNVVGIDLPYDKPEQCDLVIDNNEKNELEEKVQKILKLIKEGRNETR
jgi:adenylylsulfate kinase-like enzyme